jgi:hypothetical protein
MQGVHRVSAWNTSSYGRAKFGPIILLAPSERGESKFYFGVVKLSRTTDTTYATTKRGEWFIELFSSSAVLGGAHASVSHLVVASDARPYEAQQSLRGKLSKILVDSKGIRQEELHL